MSSGYLPLLGVGAGIETSNGCIEIFGGFVVKEGEETAQRHKSGKILTTMSMEMDLKC